MVPSFDTAALANTIVSLTFPLAVALTLWKRSLRETGVRLLVLYTLVCALTALVPVLEQTGRLSIFRQAFVDHIPFYAALLLAWMFLGLTLQFLRIERGRPAWLIALAGVAALILLDSNLFNLPDVLWANPNYYLPRAPVTLGAVLAGWAACQVAATVLVVKSYRGTHHPLHRNRINYWMPILGLAVAADGLAFALRYLSADGLRLLAILAAVYVTSNHELPDVRQAFRRVIGHGALILVSVLVYAASFVAVTRLLPSEIQARELWAGGFSAVALVLIFNPLLRQVGNFIDRLISGKTYDPTGMLHEYSLTISNILDLDRLTSVVLGLIRPALRVSKAVLLLVDAENMPRGTRYSLRANSRLDPAWLKPVTLHVDSPIAAYLSQEQIPLTQYDIDLLPRFGNAAADELAWFSASGMDVYVPISAHGEWIGLLILGPKTTGDRYFEEELAMLTTLASQTAVALENARLVKDLVQLNKDLSNANTALGQAKQQLERLDQVKSDFISIASHELLTPITLLCGYSQMLTEEKPLLANPYYLQMVNGINAGTSRLHEIVESMLDMAKIDSRTFKLDTKAVTFPELIHEIYDSLKHSFLERGLGFEVADLSDLPAIEADREALTKVFSHLIVNAIKYTPDGGKIFAAGQVLRGNQTPLMKDCVEIVVSDTGIGIDPRYQELVFTKFYQTGEVSLHSTGKTKFKGGGPGLGLAIVRGIVEAHHGKVWVESPGYDEEACPGSHFHVLLPIYQNSQDQKTLPPEAFEINPAAFAS